MSSDPTYRVYCHDGAKRIVNAEWVNARSDDEAIAAVRETYPKFECELWAGNRLVAKIAAGHLTA